jgi:hypothetical protein
MSTEHSLVLGWLTACLAGDILMAEGIAIRYQPGSEAREELLARWGGNAPLG